MNVPVHAVTAPIAKNYVLYNSQPYEGEVIKAKMWFLIHFQLYLIYKNHALYPML